MNGLIKTGRFEALFAATARELPSVAWTPSDQEAAMRKKKLLQNTLFAAIVACAVYVLHSQADADVAALSASAVASSQNW